MGECWETIEETEIIRTVKEAVNREINWAQLPFQILGIYEVLDIIVSAINRIQKDGTPYHMLHWEKERIDAEICSAAHLKCICPNSSTTETVTRIRNSVFTKYSRHADEELISFSYIVNHRITDGILTNKMKKEAGIYFSRCYDSNDKIWLHILEILESPQVQADYGYLHPCLFWNNFMETYYSFLGLETKEEIEELADMFCDYSTLPSSSAYVERCFSIEKRIIKTKMNIGDKKIEASLRKKTENKIITTGLT